jgi:ABC-2 type transport system ATP-binding protein
MLQRVEIAQALLNDPKILILDEPTTGLDPQERIRFRNMIRRFSGDRIILLSTHIVSDVEQEADQVILLREGHVVRTGTVQEISSSVAGKAVEDGTSPLENAYLRYCGQEAS